MTTYPCSNTVYRRIGRFRGVRSGCGKPGAWIFASKLKYTQRSVCCEACKRHLCNEGPYRAWYTQREMDPDYYAWPAEMARLGYSIEITRVSEVTAP